MKKLFLTILILTSQLTAKGQIYPVGIKFDSATLARKGNFGDNWCQTWAADDNIYTMMDDGNGWWGSSEKLRGHPEWEGSMCLRISGNSDFNESNVTRTRGWPKNPVNSPLYAYGIISVDSTLYVWLWKSETDTWYRRPVANRLLYSKDFGRSFYRWNGDLETQATFQKTDSASFFFYQEDPMEKEGKKAYVFNWITFCQNGRDNSLAKDDYVYMYSPDQYNPRNLLMIRVPKDNIIDKSSYEYFKGWKGDTPEWTKDISARGINLTYPEAKNNLQWMWASWFPDVVYNKGLELYIMVSYGVTDPGKKYWDGWCSQCKNPASIGFWYAENPWGPWNQFYFAEYFYPDRKENRTYGFKLSPKWMSDDGKRMTLIWSDAGDRHSTNYKWNQMEIEIILNK